MRPQYHAWKFELRATEKKRNSLQSDEKGRWTATLGFGRIEIRLLNRIPLMESQAISGTIEVNKGWGVRGGFRGQVFSYSL